jgi:hypothetical protein
MKMNFNGRYMNRRNFITVTSATLCGTYLCCGSKKKVRKDKKMDSLSLSVCGLDCTACPLYQAQFDKKLAEELAKNFSTQENQVKPEHCRCGGCRGDKSIHWSPDCKLLACCVQKKRLDNCGECDEFPCDMLNEHAAKGDKYQEALERLRK